MPALKAVLWSLFAAAAAVLAANLWYLFRRRRPPPSSLLPSVSVVIPARNEALNLRRLLPSLVSQRGVDLEVIVYDDVSDDGTSEVATSIGDDRLVVIRGEGPPTGWVGKVHALYQGARVATRDVLLFLDADTKLTDDDALARIARRFVALPVPGVLTAIPRFRSGGALLVSAIPYALLMTLPLALVPVFKSRRVAAMNGQCWMISRAEYLHHEPHLRHAGEVLEDVRIGRYLAERGVVPFFANLQGELEVWMYETFADAWRGFRKNAYLLLGGSVAPFALFFACYAAMFLVAPFISPWFLVPAYATKILSDRFARFPVWVSALAPASFVLWAALQLDSAFAHQRGSVKWKGREVALNRRGRTR
jgi:glycosyltransferase involved in cell wall biosynthesis